MWSHLSGCHAPLMRKYFIDSLFLGAAALLSPPGDSGRAALYREETPTGDLMVKSCGS